MISNHSATANTLQICDIITYNDDVDASSTYRIKSFLKQWKPPALSDEEQSIMDLLDSASQNEGAPLPPSRIALVRCSPDDAEFVSASGTCGLIAPISHVKRIGCVNWDDESIANERSRYAKLDTGRAMNYLAHIDDQWGFLNKK